MIHDASGVAGYRVSRNAGAKGVVLKCIIRGPRMPTEWVFFDDGCGFCHRWVQVVVKHDHDWRAFRFAPRKGALLWRPSCEQRPTLGTAPAQKTAALTDDIRAMVDSTDAGIIGVRDRALILFAGAFRRSELVRLDVEDCAFGKAG